MIYLILLLGGQALWSMPQPYPTMEACEAAGANWDRSSGGYYRRHYCLPGPIIAPPAPPMKSGCEPMPGSSFFCLLPNAVVDP